METKEGIIKVKIKKNGSRDNKKTHISIGKQKLSISKEFQLDNLMNGKECIVYLENNDIVDIKIDGQNIKKGEKKKKVKKISKCENKKNLRIPNDTCLILQNLKINIENFHLKLNKFSKFDEDKGYKLQNQKISETFFNNNWSFYEKKIKAYCTNIKKLNLNFSDPIKFKTDYRLVVGAEQSIYETSIRLHHIYGIPFIPSTAIKGVVRSYIEQEEKLDKFIEMFGDENQEGKIIFFDAFPTSKPKIKVDIINPHYGHYYSDGKAPTDDNNPIPINFLTVEDTTFKFLIASKERMDEGFILLFKEALANHGIGAKTAVGYGYFS